MFSRGGSGDGPDGGPPRGVVGVFGKHPAWPDFMDDIGLTTPALVEFRQVLYVDGLRKVIDSGRWERPATGTAGEAGGTGGAVGAPGGGGPVEFNHEFAAVRGGSTLFGRLWASSDAKGRARYPLVTVADVGPIDPVMAVSVLPASLVGSEQRIRDGGTPAEVHAATAAAQVALNNALPSAMAASGAAGQPKGTGAMAEAVGALADAPELGPERLRLHRLLYHIERELGEYGASRARWLGEAARPRGGSRLLSSPQSTRARHMRLPEIARPKTGGAPGVTPFEAIVPWLRLLRAGLDPTAPLLVLRPLGREGLPGGGWIDAIVGTPTNAELYCIKAGLSAVPLTTEVPYTLDEEFLAGIARLNGQWAG